MRAAFAGHEASELKSGDGYHDGQRNRKYLHRVWRSSSRRCRPFTSPRISIATSAKDGMPRPINLVEVAGPRAHGGVTTWSLRARSFTDTIETNTHARRASMPLSAPGP